MLTQEKIDSINTLSDSLTSVPIEKLVINTASWGPINFELAREDLSLTFSLCNHLKSLPISILPDAIANLIIAAITAAAIELISFIIVDLIFEDFVYIIIKVQDSQAKWV